MPSVLWWGRGDSGYSRNRVLLKLFSDLGWSTDFFHPVASRTGRIEAYFHQLTRPDLLWVPCFRHRDILSASHWAEKWQVPLVVDVLISAYEKDVFEKRKWPPDSMKAEHRRRWESGLLSKADIVIVDTSAHGDFFKEALGLDPDKVCVLYVGAETGLFIPLPAPLPRAPFEVLFYGSFLQLQGVDIIVKAASKTLDLDIKWVLLGDGDSKSESKKLAQGLKNIVFEPRIDYDRLPDRLKSAHVLLGIFGTTIKANLVIPNKMFQAMAVGRPVITRSSRAYPEEIRHSAVIGWVPAGNPEALAGVVRKWFNDPGHLAGRGKETRKLFDDFFGEDKLKEMLEPILEKALGV